MPIPLPRKTGSLRRTVQRIPSKIARFHLQIVENLTCRSESFVPSADDSSRLPPHEIETVSGWVSVAATSAGVLITALWSQDFGVKIAGKRRRSSKHKGDGEILTPKPCATAAALMAAIIEAACAAPAAGSDSILLMVA